jgi:heptosyltransferase I
MKIAIVKLSALGDIVHAMIVIQFIKKFNKEISIDWFVEEGFKDLLEFHPDINKVYSINFQKVKKEKSLYLLFKELKKVNKLNPYDLVIDMQGLIKSAIISKLIPSKQTLGFDKFSSRERLASIFYSKTFKCSYTKNVIERNIALIENALGFCISDEEIYNKIPFLHSKRKKLSFQQSDFKKNIILIPGASNKSKRFPHFKLAELTKLIDANFIIIWSSEEEKFLAQQIKEISHDVNICNKLQLDSLILLISQADLVIGPDTGPTHMSWALNIPSITLFGPTPGYRNTLVTSINKIIESKSKVNPSKINKNDYSIKDISVEEVIATVKELIF